ncbi:hypothetical protein NKR23_g5927 [Pleurostoma richardsiae]|uniref:Gpi anchored protein n=1 Tax=Pleurostoma richardsiae TaxID=41990 RepID=A0AA38RXZ3_9PEZI|nr:hypothetical protein NKR23_g5927 [Pleurostoma richardsiae]
MRFQISLISTVVGLGIIALAQDIDSNDVPRECRSVCDPVTRLTRTCDRQNDDDDSGYINCVCSADNAQTAIPLCEACVAVYDTNDGHDNDVNDLVRSCSFTTTSWNSAAASTATNSAMSGPSTTSASTTQSAQTTVVTQTSGSTTTVFTSTVSQTAATAATAPTTSASTAAGSQTGAQGVGGFLAVVLGFLQLL